MSDSAKIERQLIRQAVTVFSVPAAVVRRVHDPLACALGFVFTLYSPLAVNIDDDGLIVGKQHHISPLFDHRRCLFLQFELPAIVGSQLIRLFKLTHLGMGCHDDIDPGSDDVLQRIEQLAEFLGQVGISLTPAGVLDAAPVFLSADLLDAHLLSPVCGIDHQRLAQPWC